MVQGTSWGSASVTPKYFLDMIKEMIYSNTPTVGNTVGNTDNK